MNDTECGNCKEIFRETEIEQGLCRKCWNEITDDVDKMKEASYGD